MSYCVEQIERFPWAFNKSGYRKNYSWLKKAKHKRERQRCREQIDCHPEYKRYRYWSI